MHAAGDEANVHGVFWVLMVFFMPVKTPSSSLGEKESRNKPKNGSCSCGGMQYVNKIGKKFELKESPESDKAF